MRYHELEHFTNKSDNIHFIFPTDKYFKSSSILSIKMTLKVTTSNILININVS